MVFIYNSTLNKNKKKDFFLLHINNTLCVIKRADRISKFSL